jgi:hypothetical protein
MPSISPYKAGLLYVVYEVQYVRVLRFGKLSSFSFHACNAFALLLSASMSSCARNQRVTQSTLHSLRHGHDRIVQRSVSCRLIRSCRRWHPAWGAR